MQHHPIDRRQTDDRETGREDGQRDDDDERETHRERQREAGRRARRGGAPDRLAAPGGMTIAAREGAPRPAAPPRVHAFPGPSCCVAAGPAARGPALPPPAVPSARVPGVMRWAGAPDAGRVTAHSPSEASAAPAPPKSSIVEKTSKAFVSGTISGWGQTLAGQPFDTVKVRLQANPGQYTGPMQCFMDCVKREGFTGLYKGTMAPMLGIGFCNALQFAGYEWSKERIEDGLRRQQAASGAAGAAGDAAGRTIRPLTLGEVRAPRNRRRRDARGPAALGRAR